MMRWFICNDCDLWMRRVIAWILIGSMAALATTHPAAAGNLLVNADFLDLDDGMPRGWFINQDRDAMKIIRQDGQAILEISEDSSRYVPALIQQIEVDGFESYRLQVRVRTKNVQQRAAVFYYWISDRNERMSGARFLTSIRGSNDWRQIDRVLTPDDPARTAGLRIALALYSNEGGAGKAWFSEPSLTLASAKSAAPAAEAAPRQAPPAFGAATFASHNLTSKAAGQPYTAERGRPGMLMLHANRNSPTSLEVHIDHPASVAVETYLWHRGERQCSLVPPVRVPELGGDPVATVTTVLDVAARTYDWHVWGNALFFMADATAPDRFDIRLRFHADGKELLAVTAPIQMVPSLTRLEQPRDFPIYSWSLYPLVRIDLERHAERLPGQLARYWFESGTRGGAPPIPAIQRSYPAWQPNVHATRWLVLMNDRRSANLRDVPEHLRPRPAQSVSQVDHPALFCPTSAVENAAAIYDVIFQREDVQAHFAQPGGWYEVDYEPYVHGWVTQACFCAECIQRFAARNGLNADGLTARDILEQYEDHWVRFRNQQRAEVVGEMAAALHRADPTARLLFCSMPMAADFEEATYFKHYGIDLRLHDAQVDVHTPMSYETSLLFYQRLERGIRELSKPIVPILRSGWGGQTVPEPDRFASHLVASAFLGTHGANSYRGAFNMDALLWQAQQRALDTIARFETYRDQGTLDSGRVRLTPAFRSEGNLWHAARTMDGRTAIFLVNNHPSLEIFGRVHVESGGAGRHAVRDLLTQQLWSPDGQGVAFDSKQLQQGLMVQLAPLSYQLLEILPAAEAQLPALSSEPALALSIRDVERQERDARQHHEQITRARHQDGMSAGLIRSEGKTYYELSTPAQRVLIDLEESATARWQRREGDAWEPLASAVAMDHFVEPVPMRIRHQPATLDHVAFDVDQVTARLKLTLTQAPFDGLVLEKTYRLRRDRAELTVEVALHPEGGYRPFTYRTAHLMEVGRAQAEAGGQSFASRSAYLIPLGEEVLRDDSGERTAGYVRRSLEADEPAVPLMAAHLPAGPAGVVDGAWSAFENSVTGERIRARFGEVAELFFWRHHGQVTLEWIYPPAYPDNDPHKIATWRRTYTLVAEDPPPLNQGR